MLSLLALVVSLTNKLFPSPAELVTVYGMSLLIWVELDLLFKTSLLKAVRLEDLGGRYEGLSFGFRLCSVRWEVLISSVVCS
jgi:hypothetical protein